VTASNALLVSKAELLITMDAGRRELRDCDVLVRDGVIVAVGENLAAPEGSETLDASGCLVIPGLVNSHNHVFGSLFRGLPHLHRVLPRVWVEELYKVAVDRPFTSEAMFWGSLAHFARSLLTGCTTIADHHWFYPRGGPRDYVDREVEAARLLGIRLHASRGCLTRTGHAPDGLIEAEGAVLEHADELIQRYHDPEPYSMTRIFLGPMGLDCDTRTIFRGMAELAKTHPGVELHTHVYPGYEPRAKTIEELCGPPLEYLEDLGWSGGGVVLYHFTTRDQRDIARVAAHGSWVSVCPAMDMRMSFAGPRGTLPPLRELLDASGRVCLGTSNQAMSEGTLLLDDMRVCWLADRLRFDDPSKWLTSRDVLWMATRGGCLALGRDDLGVIEPGKGADLAIFDMSGIEMAGAADPVSMLCGMAGYAKATIVNGYVVARDGHLMNADQGEIAARAKALARDLVGRWAEWPAGQAYSVQYDPTPAPSG